MGIDFSSLKPRISSPAKGRLVAVEKHIKQWIGLRENLQETMVFTIKKIVSENVVYP